MSRLELISLECDDTQLVKDALAGDRGAFNSLVYRHSARVFRLALRMLGSREDAEDVQQETFVSTYRGLRRFRADASFGTWICSITVKLCLIKRRRSAKWVQEELDEADIALCETGNDPVERLIALESAKRVQLALSKLAHADRLLIVLKFMEGMSHEEISQVLGCSVESSRSRLLRAKRLFRKVYVK